MAAPYSKIDRKAEDAITLVIQRLDADSDLSERTFYKGFSLTELVTNRVETFAPRAIPHVIAAVVLGNWTVDGFTAIVSHTKDATRTIHEDAVAVVMDIFMRDDIIEQLNTVDVEDFRCKEIAYENTGPGFRVVSIEHAVDGNEIRSDINWSMYCMPSTGG